MSISLPLTPATLLKRYQRFLADVVLADGSTTTIHVANTGAMTGCAVPGDTIWYSRSTNAKRKYPCSWELTQTQQNELICVNTLRANQLTELALQQGLIEPFRHLLSIKREVSYGQERSKVDFLVTDARNEQHYLEVKSVTLLPEPVSSTQGFFPDAVTLRGQKHLRELITMAEQGQHAALLFAVLHTGIDSVRAAEHIDATYATLLRQAQQAGVAIYAYKMSAKYQDKMWSLALTKPVPVQL
jgi:sugar fermentation stimulation protein A